MKKNWLIFFCIILWQYSSAQDGPINYVEPKKKKSLRRKKVELPLCDYSGREYYDSLVKNASHRHWAFPISFYYTTESGGFNCDGCSTSLAASVFGKDPITFKDIYLFSKLSCDNKVRINNCDAKEFARGSVFIGMAGVPFGGFADDLYTTLLGPVQVKFDASQREFVFLPSVIFRYDLDDRELFAVSAGITVPLKSRLHTLDLAFVNGELFREGFVPDTTQRETSLKQFFREYSSVEDFFFRAVLEPKGLTFDNRQRKSGFGDISLFFAFEYHYQPTIELGFDLVFPTSGKGSGCTIWEPILGNGGIFQFSPFLQLLFSSVTPYLNPFFRIATEVSSSISSTNFRVPKLVTNPKRQMVKDVPGLDHPDTFENFYVDPFSEFDSCIPLLSERACMKKKTGNKILIGVGNYAYNLFHENFRWGLYYDFFRKSKDSFEPGDCDCCCESNPPVDLCLTCTQADICTLEKCSGQKAHIISTNLTYKFPNLFELSVGGEFTVLGKNVPRNRSFYFNVLIIF